MRQAAKPPLTGVTVGIEGRDSRCSASTLERDVPPSPAPRMRFLAATVAALVTGLTLTAAPAEAAPEQAPEQATGQASQALCATPAPGTFGCFARRRTETGITPRAPTANTPD